MHTSAAQRTKLEYLLLRAEKLDLDEIEALAKAIDYGGITESNTPRDGRGVNTHGR